MALGGLFSPLFFSSVVAVFFPRPTRQMRAVARSLTTFWAGGGVTCPDALELTELRRRSAQCAGGCTARRTFRAPTSASRSSPIRYPSELSKGRRQPADHPRGHTSGADQQLLSRSLRLGLRDNTHAPPRRTRRQNRLMLWAQTPPKAGEHAGRLEVQARVCRLPGPADLVRHRRAVQLDHRLPHHPRAL